LLGFSSDTVDAESFGKVRWDFRELKQLTVVFDELIVLKYESLMPFVTTHLINLSSSPKAKPSIF
jgi:hypothetical protein